MIFWHILKFKTYLLTLDFNDAHVSFGFFDQTHNITFFLIHTPDHLFAIVWFGLILTFLFHSNVQVRTGIGVFFVSHCCCLSELWREMKRYALPPTKTTRTALDSRPVNEKNKKFRSVFK